MRCACIRRYVAQLTPTGSAQLERVGQMLAERYVRASDLFTEGGEPLSAAAINDVVKAHTSNLQRTLMSSWSFLQGMFPQTPRHFSYLCDRQDVDMVAVERKLEKEGQVGTGIRMVVEPGTGTDGTGKDDMLFHQANRSKRAQDFRKVAFVLLRNPALRAGI